MASSNSGSRLFASPLARRMAIEKGLDINMMEGTGPSGRIIAGDVEDAAKAGVVKAKSVEKAPVAKKEAPKKATLDSAGDFVDMETTQIRKVIAERLSYSKQNIPHYYVTVSVQVDKLLALRARLNKQSTSKISVNDMVMKATSMAALKVPETNSSW